MLVSFTDTFVESAPAEAAPAAPAAPVTPGRALERPDEPSALATARLTRKPVKITGKTTETSEFVALPDGSIEATTTPPRCASAPEHDGSRST